MNTDILGLHIIDIGVMIAYFAVVLYIGYRAMKQINGKRKYRELRNRQQSDLVSHVAIR